VTPVGVEPLKVGRPVSRRHASWRRSRRDPGHHPLAGGEPAVRGWGDVPICFTPDGRELFVARSEETPPLGERVESATGRARPWTGMRRNTPSGLFGQHGFLVTPDGQSYAYSYFRIMSDLYLATGLK
jgi:hypothetical protein